MKKLLLLFTFVYSLCFANEVSDKEQNLYMQGIKEKEVEQQLISSPQFVSCKEKFADKIKEADYNDQLRKCVVGELGKLDDEAIDTLGDRLNLGSFDAKAAETSKSIREYLNDRLSNAIYGDEKNPDGTLKAFNQRRMVDHGLFYKLYEEQIGKNTLLSLSQYCLENLGVKELPDHIVDSSTAKPIAYPIVEKDGEDYKVIDGLNHDQIKNSKSHPKANSIKPLAGNLYKNLTEYEICSGTVDLTDSKKNTGDCAGPNAKNKRSMKMITKMKEAEFVLGGTSSGQDFTKKRFTFCAAVTHKMCEQYKCKNVYNSQTPQGEEIQRDTEGKISNIADIKKGTKNYCNAHFGITEFTSNTSLDETKIDENANLSSQSKDGVIACSIMTRLVQYRKTIAQTKQVAEDVNKQFKTKSKLNTSVNMYSGKGGQKDISELTSISSAELNKVDDLNKLAENAEELKKECMEEVVNAQGASTFKLKPGAEENENCLELQAKVTKENIKNITAEAESETAVLLQDLGQKQTADQIKEFLEKNGMSEIINREDFLEMDIAEQRQFITDYYRSKKMTELDAIKQRFALENQVTQKTQDDAPDLELEEKKEKVAVKTVENLEQHKKRVQDLVQYSNIVSSYLTLDDGSGDSEQAVNVTGRKLELENPNEQDEQSASLVKQYFGGGVDQGSSGDTSTSYLEAIDQILGDKSLSKDKN